MAVLLLIFLYQHPGAAGGQARFVSLSLILGGSLVFLQMAPETVLLTWYFQAGLFLGDAALAALILHWSRPGSDLYLIFFLIIFGTALTRNLAQSLVVALVTTALYLITAWHPQKGLPQDTSFWLRVHFLLVSSALMAILSRDSREAQKEQENKYQERLVQFGRLAALGQLAGEVAHRIKGPLTTILVNAEVLSHRAQSCEQSRKELAQIRDEVCHCRDILKGLLDLGRIEEMDHVRFDLREALTRALAAVAARASTHGVRVETDFPEAPLPVKGDPSLMQEAISAVLHNAVDAVHAGGHIKISARIKEDASALLRWRPRRDICEITIEDDGKGILKEDLERIFQPFFTTKGKDGSGLGLSAALRILQKHGGSVEAFSMGRGKGACFNLCLPCHEPARRRRRRLLAC